MTDEDPRPTDDGEGALDANLRELLRRAPEPARLDAEARTRLADALRAAPARRSPGPAATAPARGPRRHTSGAGAPRPALSLRRRAVLTAAALLAAVALGALLLDPFGGPAPAQGGPDDAVARQDSAAPLDGFDGPGGGEADDGTERAPADVNGADTQLAEAQPARAPDAAEDVLGTLWFDGEALPDSVDEVEVWSRPVVGLPRVADSRVLRVPVPDAAPTQDARLAFTLRGERARARDLGADRIEITAIAPGLGRGVASVEVKGEGAAAVEISPGVTVVGTVTDARTGTPVAGALVIPLTGLPLDSLDVAERPSDALPTTWAETDAGGRFRIEGVAGPPVKLRASAPGFAPASAEPVDVEAFERAFAAGEPLPPLEVSIELGPGGAVEGVVEREDGSRFAGALVIASQSVMDPRPGRRDPLTYGGAVADGQGRYRIEDLPEGAHVVLVFDADGGRGGAPRAFRFTGVESGETARVDFLSTASGSGGGSIVGTLRGPGGAPIPGASLTIGATDGGGSDWSATTTGDDGAFRFADLEAGEYTLLAADDDFRTLSLVWSGSVEGPVTLDLERTPHSIALAPVAYDETSQGMQRLEAGWAMLERRSETGAWEFAGSQDVHPDGRRLAGVPAGRYRATYIPVDGSGLGAAFGAPFEVPSPDGAPFVIEVPEGRSLDVLVVDAAGVGVPGAVVDAVSLEAGRSVPTQDTLRTDAAGRARVPAVPLGRVRVDVRASGGRGASAETLLDVASAEDRPLRVVLE